MPESHRCAVGTDRSPGAQNGAGFSLEQMLANASPVHRVLNDSRESKIVLRDSEKEAIGVLQLGTKSIDGRREWPGGKEVLVEMGHIR